MPKIGKDLLSDVAVKGAKSKDKPHALRDGGGLWLVIEPTGKKWWKLRTVFVKKNNSFSLGVYPEVTLSTLERHEIKSENRLRRGLTTKDLARCRLLCRLVAMVYTWWTLFFRLTRPHKHFEALSNFK